VFTDDPYFLKKIVRPSSQQNTWQLETKSTWNSCTIRRAPVLNVFMNTRLTVKSIATASPS